MESVSETRSRSPEERKVEWSRLERIGVKLDNAALTRTEREELMNVLIDNKDLFATDMAQLAECSSLPPFEIHIKIRDRSGRGVIDRRLRLRQRYAVRLTP